MIWKSHVPQDLQDKYEIHDYHHAAAILAHEFPDEFNEICDSLRLFKLLESEVKMSGGSESRIPKRFSRVLRPKKWEEKILTATQAIDGGEVRRDTHRIDYVKGQVAFEVEWNSKDQTFDRDLYAFRSFFEYNRISVGVLVTRSNDLDSWFKSLGSITDRHGDERKVHSKYGASTTHMGKLLPRLEANRNGGCPVLVFGITQKLLSL